MDFLLFLGDSQASPHLQLPHRDLLDLGVLAGVPPSQHVDLGVDVVGLLVTGSDVAAASGA